MPVEVFEVLKKINEKGYSAYLVGGYPRDKYMGMPSSDYDVCTDASFRVISNIFENLSEEKHGSIKLKYKGIRLEITTFRKEDSYSSIRTPNISYTSSLEEDLKRRDFTINTICIEASNQYIDLLNGIRDIDNKLIRCVGNPDIKMSEDPLRILRAIRFATTLDFAIEDYLIIAIKTHAYLVKNLSYYRKKEELDKIFNHPNIEKGIKLIREFNLDKYLNINLDNVFPISSSIAMWAQIDTDNNYEYTKKEKKSIEQLRKMLLLDRITKQELYNYSFDNCELVAKIKGDDIGKLYEEMPIKTRRDINISPSDLNHDNMNISEIYSLIEISILNGELANNREEIMEFIKNIE